VVATDNTTLTNPAAKALAHGTANLPLWKLAMTVDVFRAPDLKTAIMNINLTGPLDKPSIGVTGPIFQGGQSGNPLQQLIPGALQPQPTAGGGSGGSAPQPTANDPLQQLLKGLQPRQPTTPAPAQAPQSAWRSATFRLEETTSKLHSLTEAREP